MSINSPDDEIIFADQNEPEVDISGKQLKWKVMIVDDERSVHDVTELALADTKFLGRKLEFIHCFSGEEAREAIKEHPDTAVMLLDVVMESEHAGLDVVKHVRNELKNQFVRIVLRTGQPGQAPERSVITDYDINDYKEKTELTATKLFTLIYSSLRAYRDIKTIEASKRGLTNIIEASADIFRLSALDQFAKGVLEQLAALLGAEPGAVYLKSAMPLNGIAACFSDGGWRAIAGTGCYSDLSGNEIFDVLNEQQKAALKLAESRRESIFEGGQYVGYFEDRLKNRNILILEGASIDGEMERTLLELFTRNVSIAFENINLHRDIEDTQQTVVCMLGEAVETRSSEMGNHVRRVAEISGLIAREYGLSSEEIDVLVAASPLHDLGKIGIPDAVLNKPGRHTDEEREVMRTHCEIGYRMLRRSKKRILRAGAVIAMEHHERWDGNGYPYGKSGEDIDIYARITAAADVFEALSSKRCYKEPWPLERVKELFEDERGRHFDPRIADIVLGKFDEITGIMQRYADK